jgi:DNA polymerase III subunit delta
VSFLPRKRVESIDELKSVYFIYGDEELLVEDALKRLRRMVSAEADADFNIEVLDALEVGAERVIDSAETVPLMSSRRLVIAREVDRLSKKEQDILSAYLERPNPATTLVLVTHIPGPGEHRDSKALKRIEASALFKKGRSAGEVMKFSIAGRGRQQKTEDWVRSQFEKRGKRIKPEALQMLTDRVGRELRDLEDAVERLSLFASDKDTIEVCDISEVVVSAAEQPIFELVDAVADRRRDLSLYLLNRLLRQGESPERIFSLLLRQFRLIARCKSLSAEHDFGVIASELGIPPFLVGKCIQQSKKYSSDRLRSSLGEFKRAQIEMHSSGYISEPAYSAHVLETLIVKVVG